jgi:hypothetical protein
MSDESGDAIDNGPGAPDGHAESATAAGVACILVAIGALRAVVRALRQGRGRRWPASKAVGEPADFTPPHGDPLMPRT